MKRQPRNWSKVLTVCILVPFLGSIGLAAALAVALFLRSEPEASVQLMQALQSDTRAPAICTAKHCPLKE